jgi:hypothetical protein
MARLAPARSRRSGAFLILHVTAAAVLHGEHTAYIRSKVSKSRQTRDQHHCSTTAQAILILRNPDALPHTPPCAWARGYFDGSPGPRAEGEDRTFATRLQSTDKGTTKGTKVASGCPTAGNRSR